MLIQSHALSLQSHARYHQAYTTLGAAQLSAVKNYFSVSPKKSYVITQDVDHYSYRALNKTTYEKGTVFELVRYLGEGECWFRVDGKDIQYGCPGIVGEENFMLVSQNKNTPLGNETWEMIAVQCEEGHLGWLRVDDELFQQPICQRRYDYRLRYNRPTWLKRNLMYTHRVFLQSSATGRRATGSMMLFQKFSRKQGRFRLQILKFCQPKLHALVVGVRGCKRNHKTRGHIDIVMHQYLHRFIIKSRL